MSHPMDLARDLEVEIFAGSKGGWQESVSSVTPVKKLIAVITEMSGTIKYIPELR